MIPAFKAGIHTGDVIAGEVGIIKRDIPYSGDAFNTTAEIQGKRREFETEKVLHANPERRRRMKQANHK